MEERTKLEELQTLLLRADEDGLSEMRLWLFKESCRLEHEERQLDVKREKLKDAEDDLDKRREKLETQIEREREALQDKEELVEQKLQMLREAYDRLDDDKERLKRDRNRFEKEKSYFEGASYYDDGKELLFMGVNSQVALKKRYKDLVRIFHPDNICGDERVIQIINQEYESLRESYKIKA